MSVPQIFVVETELLPVSETLGTPVESSSLMMFDLILDVMDVSGNCETRVALGFILQSKAGGAGLRNRAPLTLKAP